MNPKPRGLFLSLKDSSGGVTAEGGSAPYAIPVPTPPNSFLMFGGDAEEVAAILALGRSWSDKDAMGGARRSLELADGCGR